MNFTQTTVKKIFIEVIIPADKQVTMTYYNRQSWIEEKVPLLLDFIESSGGETMFLVAFALNILPLL